MLHQKRKLAALLLFGMISLSCCNANHIATESDGEDTKLLSEDAIWIPYWDQEKAEDQLKSLDVEKICLFGAYFDEKNELVVPENTKELAAQLKNSGQYTLYLTVVNDIVFKEKENSLKDTELLTAVLGTEEAARQHVLKLLDMVQFIGLDGIEIDYERIRKDYGLWDNFTVFLEQLLPEADRRSIAVRVLLEPGTPIENLTLPEGPDYVVMCYNLNGSGTEPGPKADRDFLLSLKQRFGVLPNVSYALANGGYRWGNDGSVSSVTTSEAIALSKENDVTPLRDADSGALSFAYQEDGVSYTVWYGDTDTLEIWTEILNENESERIPISIWRLNG